MVRAMDGAERRGSLQRALSLLVALSTDELTAGGGAGVSQLAAMTAQDKSQVSRTLRTLADEGLVERDPRTLLYRLGWQLYALAAQAGDQRLLRVAAPVLLRTVGETGERSHLSVLRGRAVLTVLTESGSHSVQTLSWVGRTVPCHATSSGRALLLDHDRDALVRLLGTGPLELFGPNCPVDVDDLHARIQDARLRGIVLSDEDFEAGLLAVSAPVRDVTGRIVAALNISAPKFRLASRVDVACTSVAAAAAELSRQLGWLPAHASVLTPT